MRWSMWDEVCEMKYVRWSIWYEVCEMKYVRWSMWDEVCEMKHVIWSMWDEVCEMKYVRWSMWDEVCEMKYVSSHTSSHILHLTYFISHISHVILISWLWYHYRVCSFSSSTPSARTEWVLSRYLIHIWRYDTCFMVHDSWVCIDIMSHLQFDSRRGFADTMFSNLFDSRCMF